MTTLFPLVLCLVGGDAELLKGQEEILSKLESGGLNDDEEGVFFLPVFGIICLYMYVL